MTAFILPAGEAAGRTSRPAPGPAGRPRVMKADDVNARHEGARLRAEQATARARSAELDDAYLRGVAAGRAAAEAEGHEAAVRGATAMERLAAETARLAAEEVDATDATVLGAVLDVTGWILRCEPSQASRTLLDRLSQAARTLTPGPKSVVRCSPADLETVTGWARSGVEVVPDPRLLPGEARLDRGDGSAVLTFSAALRRAAETLGLDPAPTLDGAR